MLSTDDGIRRKPRGTPEEIDALWEELWQELEFLRIIMTHPEVGDCTVIPVEDEEAGEVPRAYVVAKPGSAATLTEESVIDFVAERVAPYKKLRGGVVFTDEIPKTASGKILRRLVIEKDRA